MAKPGPMAVPKAAAQPPPPGTPPPPAQPPAYGVARPGNAGASEATGGGKTSGTAPPGTMATLGAISRRGLQSRAMRRHQTSGPTRLTSTRTAPLKSAQTEPWPGRSLPPPGLGEAREAACLLPPGLGGARRVAEVTRTLAQLRRARSRRRRTASKKAKDSSTCGDAARGAQTLIPTKRLPASSHFVRAGVIAFPTCRLFF